MARYSTPEEVLAELKLALGSELGQAFHQLQNDLVWLHMKWGQYRTLYGTSPQRVEMLNEAAPLLFRIVEDVLWDETLLSIARLTDHPGEGTRQRLTVRQLPPLIADSNVSQQVFNLVDNAVGKAAFARDWRNRRVAHRDLAHALDPHVMPLAPASRLAVEEALESLREVLNGINRPLRDTTFLFDFDDPIGGAETLLHVLRDGLAVRREREAAIREGRVGPPDWGVPPAV
jgi:hypothetical protein